MGLASVSLPGRHGWLADAALLQGNQRERFGDGQELRDGYGFVRSVRQARVARPVVHGWNPAEVVIRRRSLPYGVPQVACGLSTPPCARAGRRRGLRASSSVSPGRTGHPTIRPGPDAHAARGRRRTLR